MEDVKLLTYLAAVPDEAGIDVPDSSLRHLLRVDRHHDLCALEAHFLAVQGSPAPSIPLGHERMGSGRFYEYVRQRIEGKGWTENELPFKSRRTVNVSRRMN